MRCAFQLLVHREKVLRAVTERSQVERDGWTHEAPLHLTVLHLGRLEELASEVAGQTRSQKNDVEIELRRFVNGLALLHREYSTLVKPIGFALWHNPGRSFLVMEVERDSSIVALRDNLVESMLRFLAGWGIGAPREFLDNSPTVQMRQDWQPHITLAYLDRDPGAQLPEIKLATLKMPPHRVLVTALSPSSRGPL